MGNICPTWWSSHAPPLWPQTASARRWSYPCMPPMSRKLMYLRLRSYVQSGNGLIVNQATSQAGWMCFMWLARPTNGSSFKNFLWFWYLLKWNSTVAKLQKGLSDACNVSHECKKTTTSILYFALSDSAKDHLMSSSLGLLKKHWRAKRWIDE